MATSMRAVKLRINATKKTSQITKAMNMISASKLKNAEKSIKSYRPFLEKVEEILSNLVCDKNIISDVANPLLKQREVKKVCFVVIASDKGLAGAFNINVLKELQKQIKELEQTIKEIQSNKGVEKYLSAVSGSTVTTVFPFPNFFASFIAAKVSVIVPVYNTKQYIARCMDALMAQTLCDMEIIIIDNK